MSRRLKHSLPASGSAKEKNLLITGLTGAGKSYIGCALAVCALKKFMSVRYIKCSMLMREIAAFRAQDDPVGIIKYLNEMTKTDLLILDDFGLMSLDIDHCRDLFEVIDGRSPTRSTMVISQLPVKNWYDLFENRTYADSCLDRLLGNAFRLDFLGEFSKKPHRISRFCKIISMVVI